MKKSELFTPIDGVIVEIAKKENSIGIEIAGNSSERNEGIVLNDKINMTEKMRKEFGENDVVNIKIDKGKKIKFTEGFDLGEGLFFVSLDKIIGIF